MIMRKKHWEHYKKDDDFKLFDTSKDNEKNHIAISYPVNLPKNHPLDKQGGSNQQ